jgi:glycerophosphoryl diester phosphodiesterase
VEFDIRESKDGKLIVFHDSKISRIVPKTKHNLKLLKNKKFKKIAIKNLTAKTISKLILENNAHIPTLEEVLQASVNWNLKKPIHIEIKALNTDKARMKLIKIVDKYSKKLDISFIAFSKNFYKSFPYPPRWIHLFQKYNLHFYQMGRHEFTQNLFEDMLFSQVNVVLAETYFNIKNTKRRKDFLITFSNSIQKNSIIKIGIYHGADNTGDKGLYVKIKNLKETTTLMQGFSDSTGWKWFSFNNASSKSFKVIIEDLDTKLEGKYPGNAGKIKIISILKK